MGDLQVLTEDRPFPPSSPSSPSNPHPLSIGDDCWLIAEQTTQEIICQIQLTVVSEQRRKAVIDYVQRLIRGHLGIEVFPYGSVPLKTYLPDGDIDLTVLSNQNVEDAVANAVRNVLEGEEHNNASEFEVKDVQHIHAEVKLVKCLVQNIVVDISFNQLGGLCTLCFLEEVDRHIGKDHLFKRSIILIKAWCYYESRILGAHHGLISTYALETLVLYIFHLFHSSLNGPLVVLYRFLDYFSKFDWDKDCVSLNDPICLSSLPEIVAENLENDGGDLLLSKEFLGDCVEMFSVPSKGLETHSRAFPRKHFNIVDPLKENNNLGRSVSKGNFYRIRSAFAYGARKLGRILLVPVESIADELDKFFMNTLDRHGSGQRPDVQDPAPTFGANGFGLGSSESGIEKYTDDKTISGSSSVVSSGSAGEFRNDYQGSLCERISDIRITGTEKKPGTRMSNEPPRHTTKSLSPILLERDGFANGNAVSGHRLVGDAKDLATFRIQGSRIRKATPNSTPPSSEPGTSPVGGAHRSPHLEFSIVFPENGEVGNGNRDRTKPANSGILQNKVSNRILQAPDEESTLVLCQDLEEIELTTNNNDEDPIAVGSIDGVLSSSPIMNPFEDFYLGYRENDSEGTAGNPEAFNSLMDLSGDNESHLWSLQYGKWCHGVSFCEPVLSIHPLSPTQFQNKPAWDNFRRSVQLKRNVAPHMNINGVVSGLPFYNVNPAFGVEEMPKQRGTGTYFPNMVHSYQNHRSYRDRPTLGRGRNLMPVTRVQLQRPPRNNCRAVTPPKKKFPEKGSHGPSQAQMPGFPGCKAGSLELYQVDHPEVRGFPYANGYSFPSEKLEFGSFGQLPLGAPLPELSRQTDSSASQGTTSSIPSPAMQRPRLKLDMNKERIAVQSYHLKDENDFPPLSGLGR